MDEKLVSILKYLRLRNLLDHWDEYMAMARKKRMSVERLMTLVLEEEYVAKCDNARLLRRQRAHIPEILEIETFPFSRQPNLDRKRIMSLYDGFDYMTKQRNIIWLGKTGCGQTGIGDELSAAGPRSRLPGVFHYVPRVGCRVVPISGRPVGTETPQTLCVLRLPGHR